MADESLCRPQEKILFSCTLDQGIASVCASENISEKAGYLQFRYGNAKKLEVAWPKPKFPPEGVTKGKLLYDGKFGDYLRFTVDNDAFVVFGVPKSDNGVVIILNGKISAKKICKGIGTQRLAEAPAPQSAIFAVSGSIKP